MDNKSLACSVIVFVTLPCLTHYRAYRAASALQQHLAHQLSLVKNDENDDFVYNMCGYSNCFADVFKYGGDGIGENMGVSMGENMVITTDYELSDFEWECLEKILPRENFGRGRPASNTRTKVNGMLWIARTRSNWRDLPEYYGNWQTVYSTFRKWRRNGVLHKLCAELADTPEMASICEDLSSIKTRHSSTLPPRW